VHDAEERHGAGRDLKIPPSSSTKAMATTIELVTVP
jgi:hypothetical protein